MATAKDILNEIKEKDVKYVDVRFTDIRGKMQHVTFDIDLVDEEFLNDGTMFDGSSIAGWKAINESDMKLRPDLSTAIIDPFYQQTTLCLFCDVVNPDTGTPYDRDPRSIAKAALNFVKASGIGDTVFFGPEAEFFIFDDVKWSTDPHNTGYSYDASELPVNTNKAYPEGNMGHRPSTKGGYFPVNPVDSAQDLRGEMLAVMGELGMKPEKHHHEVAPAQHELGLKFDTMIVMADRLQLYKYVIHNVAASWPSRCSATTGRACMSTNQSGATASRCSRATSTPACRRCACGTSVASSSTPRRSTPSRTRPQTPTSVWCPAMKPR
jgi:glutamine synthetase